MQTISIGKLAKSAQVGVDTVRFYEKSGLLPPPPRRASGYRQYRPSDLRRLVFIRRAKELGFSLEEIAELLALKSPKGAGVGKVRELARSKLAVVERKIEDLERLRRVLQGLVQRCPGNGSVDHCPILKALDAAPGENP